MGSRAEPDSVAAKVYITAVKDLGDLTAIKVDLRLATDKPNGNLSKTVELLTEIFNQIETSGAHPAPPGYSRNTCTNFWYRVPSLRQP